MQEKINAEKLVLKQKREARENANSSRKERLEAERAKVIEQERLERSD